MKPASFFKVLETKSCEIYRAKIARIGNKNHMPDFFILFLYATLLSGSILSDAIIAYSLILDNHVYSFVLFIFSVFSRILFEIYLEEKGRHEYVPEGIRKAKIQLLFYFCGAASLVVCRKILLETYSNQRPAVKRSTIIQNLSFRVFHLSKDNVHFIKAHFFINAVLKCIPQLMILPILIIEHSPHREMRIAGMTGVLINISIFSTTMALIFPIRDTPRVYMNHTCVIFEGISKFFASASACCVSVVVFVLAYRRLRIYAVTIYVLKFIIWVWPCWRCLRSQTLPKFYAALYLILITFIASIIYIHPFKGQGKLFYYPFYLIQFLYELAYIYLTSEPDFEVLSYFFTMKVLMFSFLSAYALMNVIHKKDSDSVHRTSITSDRQEGEGGEAEVWHWREHI